jgi:hypothetical protein
MMGMRTWQLQQLHRLALQKQALLTEFCARKLRPCASLCHTAFLALLNPTDISKTLEKTLELVYKHSTIARAVIASIAGRTLFTAIMHYDVNVIVCSHSMCVIGCYASILMHCMHDVYCMYTLTQKAELMCHTLFMHLFSAATTRCCTTYIKLELSELA